jgi:hypothetical protein
MRIGGMSGTSGVTGFGRIGSARVEPIQGSPAPRRDRDAEADARAVVPLPAATEVEPAVHLYRHRPYAPFLAQLVGDHEAALVGRTRRPPRPLAIAAYARALDRPGLLVPGYFVDAAV